MQMVFIWQEWRLLSTIFLINENIVSKEIKNNIIQIKKGTHLFAEKI